MKTFEKDLHSNWWTIELDTAHYSDADCRRRKMVKAKCNHCGFRVFERKDHFLKRTQCPKCKK